MSAEVFGDVRPDHASHRPSSCCYKPLMSKGIKMACSLFPVNHSNTRYLWAHACGKKQTEPCKAAWAALVINRLILLVKLGLTPLGVNCCSFWVIFGKDFQFNEHLQTSHPFVSQTFCSWLVSVLFVLCSVRVLLSAIAGSFRGFWVKRQRLWMRVRYRHENCYTEQYLASVMGLSTTVGR